MTLMNMLGILPFNINGVKDIKTNAINDINEHARHSSIQYLDFLWKHRRGRGDVNH